MGIVHRLFSLLLGSLTVVRVDHRLLSLQLGSLTVVRVIHPLFSLQLGFLREEIVVHSLFSFKKVGAGSSLISFMIDHMVHFMSHLEISLINLCFPYLGVIWTSSIISHVSAFSVAIGYFLGS